MGEGFGLRELGARSQSRGVLRLLEEASIEVEIAKVLSKPGKDPIESFIIQGGSLGSGCSFLAMAS